MKFKTQTRSKESAMERSQNLMDSALWRLYHASSPEESAKALIRAKRENARQKALKALAARRQAESQMAHARTGGEIIEALEAERRSHHELKAASTPTSAARDLPHPLSGR